MRKINGLILLTILICGYRVNADTIKTLEIDRDTVWNGEVTVPENIEIKKGAVLTILPGTVVKFSSKNAGLEIKGALVANGSSDQKIVFTSINENNWRGLIVYGNAKGEKSAYSKLSNCIIKQADIGINYVQGIKGEISNCVFTKNGKAIIISQGADIVIKNNDFMENSEGGIDCEQGSAKVINNHFTGNKNFAVSCVKGNDIIVYENIIEKHRYGILLSSAMTSAGIKNNIVRGNEFGIYADRFAKFNIINNTLVDNGYGIYLERGAGGEITKNEITTNKTGVFLRFLFTLTINGNNIYNNEEYEIGLKETGGMEYVNKVRQDMEDKNRAEELRSWMTTEVTRYKTQDTYEYIDARGNYWGNELTEEMKKKGLTANISKIKDFYDVSSYEWEGVMYKEGSFNYSEWKDAPIEGAGAAIKN